MSFLKRGHLEVEASEPLASRIRADIDLQFAVYAWMFYPTPDATGR